MEISLEEMLNDLRITNQEIDQLKLENSILGNNYLENKLKIYMNEGRILQREDFVNKLKNIINEKRNQQVYNEKTRHLFYGCSGW